MANIKQRLLASSVLVAGLGLYSPLYKSLYKLSMQSFQDHLLSELRTGEKPRHTLCDRFLDHRTSFQTGIAISPDGKELYQLLDRGIQITNKETGDRQDFELPPQFPELSWGMDIAYDSRRDLVSIVSFGGEGYFYRFDVKNRRWLDARSLDNLDLKSLTYDRTYDRYIAWVEDSGRGGNLLFMSETGEFLFQEQISDRMIGFDRLYDLDNGRSPVVEIFARSNSIALMIYEKNSVRYIWHYDLDSKDVRLTYRDRHQLKSYSKSRTPKLYAD